MTLLVLDYAGSGYFGHVLFYFCSKRLLTQQTTKDLQYNIMIIIITPELVSVTMESSHNHIQSTN